MMNIAAAPSLVEQIAALKKATADRLVELAKNRATAIEMHKERLKEIDAEVVALSQKRTRKARAAK